MSHTHIHLLSLDKIMKRFKCKFLSNLIYHNKIFFYQNKARFRNILMRVVVFQKIDFV